MIELRPEEVRVIGCLIEKQATTPQYYPLTLNALVNACNQTSNRDPIVSYDDRTVEDACLTAREKGLVRVVHSVHNRATKYRHVLDEQLRLESQETAVLGVLMLRGPQTLGELRTRTERLAAFESLEHVERTLDALAAREEPLVVRLERQPGQKEARYAHLLAGVPEVVPVERGAAAAVSVGARADRLAQLEEEVAALRAEVAEIKEQLGIA